MWESGWVSVCERKSDLVRERVGEKRERARKHNAVEAAAASSIASNRASKNNSNNTLRYCTRTPRRWFDRKRVSILVLRYHGRLPVRLLLIIHTMYYRDLWEHRRYFRTLSFRLHKVHKRLNDIIIIITMILLCYNILCTDSMANCV